MRSENVPESPSSALQMMYFCSEGVLSTVFHLIPVGKAAPPRPRKKMKENMTINNDKISWILLLKKIVIYTILFLVFNHIKTHELVCGLLPFLSDNDLLCMTFKGIIFALIITILLPLVL